MGFRRLFKGPAPRGQKCKRIGKNPAAPNVSYTEALTAARMMFFYIAIGSLVRRRNKKWLPGPINRRRNFVVLEEEGRDSSLLY